MAGENRKNGEFAIKALTDSVAQDLEALHRAAKPKSKSDRVFDCLKSDPCNWINKNIREICGIHLDPMTGHEVGSHGAISTLLEAGYTPRVISEITNKSEETIKHYGKTSLAARSAIANQVFG